MKIVSMTMVGNESEIIESFVRYNSNFVDEMLLIMSGSVDNTLQIIEKLIEEGYPIILKDESLLSYEQRYVENKYLRYLANLEDVDLIVPLDADEFIFSKEENPRDILEKLSLNRVYKTAWKSYVMHPEDDINEKFIPKRIRYCKKVENPLITKVIVPAKLVRNKKIFLETGRHDVCGEAVEVEFLENIQVTHYPTISVEQYQSKLYCSSINFITWMNRGNGEGGHINKQIAELENSNDIYKCATGYGLGEQDKDNIIEEPLLLNFCDNTRLEIKYGNLAKVDLQKNLIAIGQLSAIRAYNLEIEKLFDNENETILIYGAGGDTQNLFNGLPQNIVNIRAYVDSNPEKKFMMYNRRLVITPDLVRFFKYDKIVISSKKYYSEMKEMLKKNRVEEDKICTVEHLFALYDELR